MLVIRRPQFGTMGLHARAHFEAQVHAIFVRNYPRECQQAGGPVALARWVNRGVDSALQAGYRSQYACGRWLLLSMMLGIDFAVDPQLPWVRDCLLTEAAIEPNDRLDQLIEESMDYLGATAGENAELVVRAMLRIRDFDFAAVPDLQGPAAVDAACDRLQSLYPEKYAYQGTALTAQCVEQQLRQAQDLGLHGAGGGFLYVLLSFMLGSGFDHDPLHAWSGEILRPETSLAGLIDRSARLEAAAREHMATSLTAGQA